jgi:hypothetical protein
VSFLNFHAPFAINLLSCTNTYVFINPMAGASYERASSAKGRNGVLIQDWGHGGCSCYTEKVGSGCSHVMCSFLLSYNIFSIVFQESNFCNIRIRETKILCPRALRYYFFACLDIIIRQEVRSSYENW